MSIPVSIARFQGKDRQDIIQEVQKQMQEGALQAIRQVLMACLEAEVTAQLGREKGEPRRASSHARESDWKCGTVDARMPIPSREMGIITGIWKQDTATSTLCPFRWWSVNAAITM